VIRKSSLRAVSDSLFADYPLAVTSVNCSGRTSYSMLLTLHDGDDARVFVLSSGSGDRSYSLRPWRAAGIAIEAGGSIDVPDVALNVVSRGVPIPQGRSLFGWTDGDTVAAMIVVYAEYTRASPEPSWAVMPFADFPERRWPPFTDKRFFGNWFWEHYRAGAIIPLNGLIADIPCTAFWVDTKAVLGSDSCAVALDVVTPGGYVLPHGRFVWYQALCAGMAVPSLQELLSDAGKIDLTSRFR
jgi:hypothetical protein